MDFNIGNVAVHGNRKDAFDLSLTTQEGYEALDEIPDLGGADRIISRAEACAEAHAQASGGHRTRGRTLGAAIADTTRESGFHASGGF